MISKIVHIFGLIFIIGFSAGSILLSMMEREYSEFQDPQLKKIMSYPSYFEDRFYDLRMSMAKKEKKFDERLVLAAIDDPSIAKIGRWPWTRTVWSDVIRKLKGYGAKIIAFDVFFSEPEVACNMESPDIDFSEAIKEFQTIPGNKVILPYTLVDTTHEAVKEMPDSLYDYIMVTKQAEGLNLAQKYVGSNVIPIEKLIDSGAPLAHIEAKEDADGIFRHYQIVGNVEELYVPSFSLMAYNYFTGDNPSVEILSQDNAEIKTAKGRIPLNNLGEAKVRWIGDASAFPVVNIMDILSAPENDEKMKKTFNGNIVFVGSTAFGAHDLRHTPVDPMLPGIYFHMNMTHALLEGNFFVETAESTKYSWIMLFGGSLLIILVSLFGHAIVDFLTMGTVVIGLFILDVLYLLPLGYDIKLFFCLFSSISCYSWTTFLQFYKTTKEKKKIKGTFASFVAPAVVDEMLKNPDKVRVGGEKKEITVFFSDVRDFTSISEKLTAEELSVCLNMYMGTMTDLLLDHQGTLDKYIGDAIVAFWNAPIEVEDHAYMAITASLKMIEALPGVNVKLKEMGFPQLKHGIGLNTGECSVGNMGSDRIFNYTALGDSMNLGARLESLCKFYGTELHISEFTKDSIRPELQEKLTFRILDKLRVKGKKEALTTYEVLHSTHPFKVDEQALIDYEKAFKLYQGKEFKAAIELLAPLAEKYPNDKSCNRVLNICREFLEVPPPPDWDGVFTHTSKG